jgi:hypothetical protein
VTGVTAVCDICTIIASFASIVSCPANIRTSAILLLLGGRCCSRAARRTPALRGWRSSRRRFASMSHMALICSWQTGSRHAGLGWRC